MFYLTNPKCNHNLDTFLCCIKTSSITLYSEEIEILGVNCRNLSKLRSHQERETVKKPLNFMTERYIL